MPFEHPYILIIDPRPILRDGIIAVITATIVESRVEGATNFKEAMVLIGSSPIDLVITDFRVHDETALPFLKELKASTHSPRCLILSSLDEIQVGYPSIRAGASGFVDKLSPVATVVTAIQTVLAGRHYVSEQLSNALMKGNNSHCHTSAGTSLTPRELQIFSLIGMGQTVSTIAAKLGVSVKTVEAHRENIKNKLGHQNSAQVTAAAVRWLDDTSVSI